MLARIAVDYLKEGPYPDAVLAMFRADRNTTTYIVDLRKDSLEVYCLVLQSDREEVQEPSAEFTCTTGQGCRPLTDIRCLALQGQGSSDPAHSDQMRQKRCPGKAGPHRAGLPEERPLFGHHAGNGQHRQELYCISYPMIRRCRESVPPGIPMQYGGGGGMMHAGRICARQNNGGPFRMHACRKITGPAP